MKIKILAIAIMLLMTSSALVTPANIKYNDDMENCEIKNALHENVSDRGWCKVFGGLGSDCGDYAQQTDDGGYIIAGITQSSIIGDRDAWLIKTDHDGNIVWDKKFVIY